MAVSTYSETVYPVRVLPITTATGLTRQLRGGTYILKLGFDRVVAACLLLALLPLLMAIALLIKLDSTGPVLFRQVRVGRHGRLFAVYKFRTMVDGADGLQIALARFVGQDGQPLFKLPDDPRVTRVGRLLRRTSLDELPQLINVLRGDMSLVGPRPPLPGEIACDRRHLARLEAVPGITGLWQVSGRSTLSFEDMVSLDLRYINGWSFTLDLSILFRTIPAVLSRRGAC